MILGLVLGDLANPTCAAPTPPPWQQPVGGETVNILSPAGDGDHPDHLPGGAFKPGGKTRSSGKEKLTCDAADGAYPPPPGPYFA